MHLYLTKHYNQLYENAIQQILADAYQVDKLIDSPNDNRFGITLILRPSDAVKREIQCFLDQLKQVEPLQYYYPDSDIHVTVMSIISCYNGFKLNQIRVEDYIDIIQQSIGDLKAFEIEFRGITASPSCLMIQGFFKDQTLNRFRDNLRDNFKKTDLEQSIDVRYSIQTAHATVFRLREQLSNKTDYLKIIDAYRDHYFGTFTVDALEFVYDDWYQRQELVKTLHRFQLNKNTTARWSREAGMQH